MIIVSKPSKPFTYTAKTTPRRPAIIAEYNDEIEALYAAVAETTQAHLPPPRTWKVTDGVDFVRSVVHHVMARRVLDTADLFHSGCDRCALLTRRFHCAPNPPPLTCPLRLTACRPRGYATLYYMPSGKQRASIRGPSRAALCTSTPRSMPLRGSLLASLVQTT